MRYIYLGDKLTGDNLKGMACSPVKNAAGKCIISQKMATALVETADGTRHVVLRRRLRLNDRSAV